MSVASPSASTALTPNYPCFPCPLFPCPTLLVCLLVTCTQPSAHLSAFSATSFSATFLSTSRMKFLHFISGMISTFLCFQRAASLCPFEPHPFLMFLAPFQSHLHETPLPQYLLLPPSSSGPWSPPNRTNTKPQFGQLPLALPSQHHDPWISRPSAAADSQLSSRPLESLLWVGSVITTTLLANWTCGNRLSSSASHAGCRPLVSES